MDGSDWQIVNFVVPNDPTRSSGDYGIVAKGTKSSSSEHSKRLPQNCVLKITRKFRIRGSNRICGVVAPADFRRELSIMTYVKENIQGRSDLVPPRALLLVYDSWEYKDFGSFVEGVFVVEELHGGDLCTFITETLHKRSHFCEDYLRHILLPVFQAIKVLHGHHIVHNDLKIENLVFRDSEHRQLVIVDFGSAYQLRWPDETPISVPTFSTTPRNFSPQQRDPARQRTNTHISPANDIYAMGYTLNRILDLCGCPLVGPDKGCRYKSNHVKDLINGMMEIDSTRRWNIDQVLASQWFTCSKNELEYASRSSRTLSLDSISIDTWCSLEANKLKPKIVNLQEKVDSIKANILDHFASCLRESMWEIGPPRRLKSISITQFSTILNNCTGLGRFQSMAAPVGEGTEDVQTVIDINGDGAIDYHEICIFLRSLKLFDKDQLFRFLFKLLDSNDDGQVWLLVGWLCCSILFCY